jgi:hypothetical protein
MNRLLLACSLSPFLSCALPAQRLIAVDSARALVAIDLVSAAKTPLATVSAAVGTPSALAFDSAAGVMFLSSNTTDSLYTVNLLTGTATLVGPYGDPALVMQGLELDSSSGQLYGASSHNGGLYTIDRSTGAATLVGLSGLAGTLNLAYDSIANRMFATSTGGDSLYAVDRATGAMTLIGNLQGSSNPQGLTFDPGTGALWLVDNASDLLYAIDPATGQAHTVGSTGAGNLLGLAFVPGGTGSVQRLVHHCGNATLFAHGDPGIGGGVTVHLGGATGVPFVGFGVAPAAVPFCGCTIGHEWAVATAGTTTSLVIPANAALLGLQVGMQGLDLFGTGGCADPAIVLTDTLLLTIG